MTSPWTVLELIRWTADYLTGKRVPEPRLTAELLLAGVLGVKRLDLYLQFDRPLRPEELAGFKARLLRRSRREPLQYIEGEAAFRELRLRVDRRVLIPRPETETLVESVLRWARGRAGLTALDVGTGSGAIALSLALEGPFSRVVATDRSADALDLAAANARRAGLDGRVAFAAGDLFEPVGGERFDVVVSNPPYIGLDERDTLAPEVRDWEPPDALFGGPDGLDVIRRLVEAGRSHLRPGGLLALEVGHGQASRVAELLETAGFAAVRIERDLAGRDRLVLGEQHEAGPRERDPEP